MIPVVTKAQTLGERRPWSALAALAAGFVAVFSLWLVWGYQLVHDLQEIEGSVRSAATVSARAERALSTIRNNVLLGSIYLRDAALGDAQFREKEYRREIVRLRAEVDRELLELPEPGTGDDERQLWQELRESLDEYWASRELPAGANDVELQELAASLRIRGHRDSVLGVLDQIGQLQRASGTRFQQEVAALYERARARLVTVGLLTLAIALGVALGVSRHAYKLQREIDRQRQGERQIQMDLQRLSARLVDAQEEERRTIARELHDEVGQALMAVKVDIGIALRGGVEARGRSALQEARDIADSTLRGVRDLSQLLHPSVLDDFGLPSALDTYVRRFSQRTGIHVELSEMLEGRLSSPLELCMYRLIQEALNNVSQHSGATRCKVSLSTDDGSVRLVVEDNGRGLPPETDARQERGGLGLIGMRERVQALRGTLDVTNRQSGGTRMTAVLPLQASEAPRARPADRRVV